MPQYIHIIAFNIPFPPNYGGVIDVFYKIKALREANIKIILHCFEYNRGKSSLLESYCEKIYYYKRNTGILPNVSLLPYIVVSRKNKELIKNLQKDNYPILFEGIHCCYYLGNKNLKNRTKLYRSANIEHVYYWNLFKSEKNSFKRKGFYLIEAFRLWLYEKNIAHATCIFPISQKETDYFTRKFPRNTVLFLPAFHQNDKLSCKEGKDEYILYHGNLSVAENEAAAIFLIRKVFNDLPYPLIIAGLNPSGRLKALVSQNPHVSLIDTPSDEEMRELIQNAHIHVLITFQATGLKLKLLNVLFEGRFCLTNGKMLEGSGLSELCQQADSFEEIKTKIVSLMEQEFSAHEIQKRKQILLSTYSNRQNIQILINQLS